MRIVFFFLSILSLSQVCGDPYRLRYGYSNNFQNGNPKQIIIIPIAETSNGTSLNNQGQQRAAYLVNFMQDQVLPPRSNNPFYPPFSVNISSPILNLASDDLTKIDYVGAFFIEKDEGLIPLATQTIIPVYFAANINNRQVSQPQVPLKTGRTFTLLGDILSGKMGNFTDNTVIICWDAAEMPDLFQSGLPQLQGLFSSASINDLWVVRWSGDTPFGYKYQQVETFNTP